MLLQFVYSPSGSKIAVVQSGALVKGTIPLPGGGSAIYNANGLNFIRHKDWLGSSRLATTWTHGVYSKEAYAPFGETYNEAGTPDRSFTGQDQDTANGVYDYLFRKYDPVAGRWLSPDPKGWGTASQEYPQSMNRYAYVQNSPMSAVDPYGEFACDPNEAGSCEAAILEGAVQEEQFWAPDASYAGSAPTVQQLMDHINSPGYGSWMFPCEISKPKDCGGQTAAVPWDQLGGNPNPFKNWPFNGDLVPFTHPQDQKFSAGPVIGPLMDSNPGMKSACIWHDNQYEAYNCNFTSWLPALPGPCTAFNIVLVVRLVGALF